MVGIPFLGLEQRDQVFVADFGRVSISLEVVLVLRAALDIHIPRIPVAIFDAGLRPPMRPDTEFCIAEPFRDLVDVERSARPLEWSRRDRKRGWLAKYAPGPCPSRRVAQQFKCVAPRKSHEEPSPSS